VYIFPVDVKRTASPVVYPCVAVVTRVGEASVIVAVLYCPKTTVKGFGVIVPRTGAVGTPINKSILLNASVLEKFARLATDGVPFRITAVVVCPIKEPRGVKKALASVTLHFVIGDRSAILL
jgi:hypothetical protein